MRVDALDPVGFAFGSVERQLDGFIVTAGAMTDIYSPPDGSSPIDRVVGLGLSLPEGPVQVSARVTPRFEADFDAGALLVRTAAGHWAKLAFELAPDKRRMAVSVVTCTMSDDANGPAFASTALYLRVYRAGAFYAFHVSEDGKAWDFLRAFNLGGDAATLTYIAQSPRGNGTEARFSELKLIEAPLADLRDGG